MMERKELVGDERTAPSPEVLEKPVRRQFTVEYKAKILAEADGCTAKTMPHIFSTLYHETPV